MTRPDLTWDIRAPIPGIEPDRFWCDAVTWPASGNGCDRYPDRVDHPVIAPYVSLF
jgi:hypothetical protein